MSKPFRKTRHFLAYIVVVQFIFIARFLPRVLGLFIFRANVLFLSLFLRGYHNVIEKNIRETFGDSKTKSDIKKIKREVFSNMGATLFDAIHIPFLSPDKIRKLIDFDIQEYHDAQAEGKGVIVLCGHMSCFELVPQFVSMDGVDSLTIGAPLFDKRITTIVENLRQRNGVMYLDRNNAGRKLMKELKNGRLFGALLDQDATNDGVFSHFMGRLAFTPSGPIRLALKFKIPLFYSILERQPDDTYKYTFKKAELLDSGDPVKDLCEVTEQYNAFLSERISNLPGQWVWMHERWKRKREDHMNFPSISDYE